MKMFKIACRIAGMLGCGGGPTTLFFPPRCFETAGLMERECDHCHQCMSMYTNPGGALEMIEAPFLFKLLMCLVAAPSHLVRYGAQFWGVVGVSFVSGVYSRRYWR